MLHGFPNGHVRMWRPPGVYRPQEDSFLLADSLREAGGADGARVLDFCTGTGFLAVTAARLGARSVTAVDIAPRAVLAARLNLARHARTGGTTRVVRGSLDAAAARGPFDIVLSNPPYVPHDGDVKDPRWDAGPNGRRVLDPLCETLPDMLSPRGFALIVHSAFSGTDETVERIRDRGLAAGVVARTRIPFGPVLRGRADYLRRTSLNPSGNPEEEVVVIRAERPR